MRRTLRGSPGPVCSAAGAGDVVSGWGMCRACGYQKVGIRDGQTCRPCEKRAGVSLPVPVPDADDDDTQLCPACADGYLEDCAECGGAGVIPKQPPDEPDGDLPRSLDGATAQRILETRFRDPDEMVSILHKARGQP